MSPAEIKSMHNRDIVEMLVSLHPSDEAVAWLAALLTDDAAFEGVRELRKRFTTSIEPELPKTPTGKHPHAGTVLIDPDRWRSFLWRRRLTMSEAGLMCGRSDGWAAVIAHRGRAGYFALDALACALSLHIDQLIDEVGTDDERARLSICV